MNLKRLEELAKPRSEAAIKAAERRKKRLACGKYRPWIDTSRGELTNVCVDDETRTIKMCDYCESINNKDNEQ